ncbi:MAG TPA: tetratricopeptide repeat protein, partial [Bacteroidia bacterium]|nr:tetratricopeptide repeat protein [Bacteroidia bacterium]
MKTTSPAGVSVAADPAISWKTSTGFLFIAACLVVLALVCWAYSNHFHNKFHFDDSHTIENNLAIRDLNNIPAFFRDGRMTSTLPANQSWRPGVTTLNAIDTAFSGGVPDPYYFHISIFTSYVILGVLLFFVLLHIFRKTFAEIKYTHWLALAGTNWYMLHTANAETINYISARTDSFSTMMVLLAFVLYFYSTVARKFYLFLIPVILGFFVKEPAIMFAPLLLVYIWLFGEPSGKKTRGIIQVVASFTTVFFLFAIYLFKIPEHWESGGGEWHEYLRTQLFVIFHYFNNFFVPVNLSADTDWTIIPSFTDDRVFAGVLFIGILLSLAWFASRVKETRPITFGILWFFIALAPTSSIFPFAEVLNDHRPFFSYIGLAMASITTLAWFFETKKYGAIFVFTGALVGSGLILAGQYHSEGLIVKALAVITGLLFLVALVGGFFLPEKRRFLVAAFLCILAGSSFIIHANGTHERNKVWKNGVSLWKDVTEKSPGNGRGWMNYGLALKNEKGDVAGAIMCFRKTLQLYPTYSYGHINMGVTLASLGDKITAEKHFLTAVQVDTLNPEGYYYYAQFLLREMRYDEAKVYLEKGKLISSQHEGINALLNGLVKVNPDFYISQSLSLYNSGRFSESAEAAETAARMKPDYGIAWNNICAAYNKTGDFEKAEDAGKKAVALDPGNGLFKNNLRIASERKSYFEKLWQDARQKNIYNTWVALSLEWYTVGNYNKSIAAAEEAIKINPHESY